MRAYLAVLFLLTTCNLARAVPDPCGPVISDSKNISIECTTGLSAEVIRQIQNAIELSAKSSGAEPDISAILKNLGGKSYEELYAIKFSDPSAACALAKCDRISGETMSKLADAIINARDKEQSLSAASTTKAIAISGAIIAILTFCLSVFNAVTAAKAKKA